VAELDHRAGNLDGAIATVEQLNPDPHVRVALADLYAAAGRPDDVIRVTDEVTNTDEAGALLLLLRGIALHQAGHTDAARRALTEASRARDRDPSIRLRALLERGQCWLADGQRARARHDFERVLAADAGFPDLAAALAAAQPGALPTSPQV
jgi:tetratricopeptide (TPR) repeat protein